MIKKRTLSVLLCLFSLVLFGVGLGFLLQDNKNLEGNGVVTTAKVSCHIAFNENCSGTVNNLPGTKSYSQNVRLVMSSIDGPMWGCSFSIPSDCYSVTRPGYVFKGWASSPTSTTSISTVYFGGSSDELTQTKTVYAIWGKGYNLYFNKNTSSTVSNLQSTLTYEVGNSVAQSVAVPTRTGYTFGGFYADPELDAGYLCYNASGGLNSSNVSFNDSANYRSMTFIKSGNWSYSGNVTLYAKWIANTYSFTLNNDGNNTTVTVTYGSSIPSVAPISKTGYTPQGYYTSTNGGGIQIYNASGEKTGNSYSPYITSGVWYGTGNNLVLYAYYTPNNYGTNISIMYDGVERNSWSDVYATFDSYYSNSDTTYANIIDQQVWYVTYGSTVRISNITNFKAGYTLKNVVGIDVGISRPSDGVYEITVPANDCSIEIVLRKADFKITYNANGGNVDYTTDYIRYGMVFGKTNIYDYSLIPSGYINGGMSLNGNTFSINENNSSDGWHWGNFDYPYDGEISSNMQYTVVVESVRGSGWLTFASPYDTSSEGLGDPFIKGYMASWNAGETTSFVMTSKSSVSSRTEFNYRSYVPVASGQSINTSFRVSVFIGRITTNGTFSYAEPGNKPSSNFLPTPTRSGYLFAGWYYGSTKITETSVYDFAQDITLTAHWVETWENHAVKPSKGTGSASEPYLISTSANLAWMRNEINSTGNSGKTYWKQTADIDMNDYIWLPIGKTSNSFYGIYDGQFFKIKNLRTSSLYTDSSGLFSSIDGGTLGSADSYNVKNVILEGADINGTEETGGIAGRLINGGKIKNCIVKGSISHTSLMQIGGIVGNGARYNNTNYVDSCVFVGTINSNGAYNGSIVGACNGTTYVRDCLGIVTNSSDMPPCETGASYDSVLYANKGSRKNTSGTFSNWIWVRGMSYPLPKGLVHIANGSAGSLTKEEIVSNFVLNDLSLWTAYYQDFTINNSSYNNMSTVSVYTIAGWECLSREISVQANSTYTITFDWSHSGYTPLSGYQGLPIQILTSSPQNNDNISFSVAMAYVPSSAGNGTISLTFSTGSYTSLFVNFNFGYIEDGKTNTFSLGNFNLVKN